MTYVHGATRDAIMVALRTEFPIRPDDDSPSDTQMLDRAVNMARAADFIGSRFPASAARNPRQSKSNDDIEAIISRHNAEVRAEAVKRFGERVTYRGHPGVIDNVSSEGIHFHVAFDAPRPGISWFYEHELKRDRP